MADNIKAQLVLRLLIETREELARADSKANILLAAVVAGAGALVGGLISKGATLAGWSGLSISGLVVATVLVLSAIFRLVSAVKPTVTTRSSGHLDYFLDISRCADPDEVDKQLPLSESEAVSRNVRQLWVLSRLALRKYKVISQAMTLMGLGVAVGLAAAIGHVIF